MPINNKQKALLHVAKAQLGLSDDEYRDILKNHGGAESSVYLDDLGCERVMKFFREIGFQKKKIRKAPEFRLLASEGQRRVIYHLMEDLGWILRRLLGFVEKMTGKNSVEMLTGTEASKVIEGLKSMRKRSVIYQ